MLDLLFEIGTEELPPNLINNLTDQLKKNIITELSENNIEVSDNQIKKFNTPRRLALIIENLPEIQEERILEIKGPDKSKAFINEIPTQVAIGFAKKHKLEPSDLKIKEVSGNEYVFAVVKTGGEDVISLLSKILPNSIKKTTGERFMKWGDYEEKFSRPIRWITAIFGEKTIPFSYGALKSTNESIPHRFNDKHTVKITSPKDYELLLEKNNTIASPIKRKNIILEQIKIKAKELDLEPNIDESLLDEVTNITERPEAVICNFDSHYLELPECIIETVLKKHQKYFVLKDKNNKLTNSFIVITNGVGKKENIKRGNEKVVRARLNDAKFFYNEDLKRPFTYEERIKDLSKVTFQKGLGTLEEKVNRLIVFSEYLYDSLSMKNNILCKKSDVSEAVKLCKLDLTSQMVFEMPELQGLISGEYSRTNNLDLAVSDGIKEHYTNIPRSIIASIIGIADKLDNVCSLFALGKIPSGSTDPFALRRQGQSIIDILLTNNLNINIEEVLDFYKKNIASEKVRGLFEENFNNFESVRTFLGERFCFHMMNLASEAEVVSAVHNLDQARLTNIVKKRDAILALENYRKSNKGIFNKFLKAAKRLLRIISGVNITEELDLSLLKTKEETDLLNAFINLEKKQDLELEDYINELTKLTDFIDLFFEKVLVNDPDERITTARRGLLFKGRNLFEKVCDFNQIIEKP